uniref:Uncharacterized protein n=1 Tax=Oryza glumipatula TaxID=40148 RepID=A0A0D9ZGB9_9ORYZ
MAASLFLSSSSTTSNSFTASLAIVGSGKAATTPATTTTGIALAVASISLSTICCAVRHHLPRRELLRARHPPSPAALARTLTPPNCAGTTSPPALPAALCRTSSCTRPRSAVPAEAPHRPAPHRTVTGALPLPPAHHLPSCSGRSGLPGLAPAHDRGTPS